MLTIPPYIHLVCRKIANIITGTHGTGVLEMIRIWANYLGPATTM